MRERTVTGQNPIGCLRVSGIGQLGWTKQLYRQQVCRLKNLLECLTQRLKERYALAVGLTGVVRNKLLQLFLCTVCRRP